MTEITPGPWKYVEGEYNFGDRASAPGSIMGDEWFVATIEDAPHAAANARLIAAAPDLLAELQAMVETFSGYQGMELTRAKAAIAKATGEKSASAADCPSGSPR